MLTEIKDLAEAIEAVGEINEELIGDGSKETFALTEGIILELHTMGGSHSIEFLGLQIWSSEDDGRPYKSNSWSNEIMPLKLYLKHRMTQILKGLGEIKLTFDESDEKEWPGFPRPVS